MTKQQVIDELTESGCRVCISLWEETSESTYLQDEWYNNMIVNAGWFDPADRDAELMEDKYPLEGLRTRILGE